MAHDTRPPLVGNRLVLAGGVMYLLEFVAIFGVIPAGVGITTSVGTPTEDLLDSYVGNVDAVSFMAAWFSIVLLGRILLMVGLRTALADSGRPSPLMDFAVVAAAVSVTLEVAAYGFASAAAEVADRAAPAEMVLLDRAGAWLNMLLLGSLAVSVAVAAGCMLRSGLFSTALCLTGLVAGSLMALAQLTIPPSLSGVLAFLSWSPLLFWVWMIWAGVVAWRATPGTSGRVRRTDEGAVPAG